MMICVKNSKHLDKIYGTMNLVTNRNYERSNIEIKEKNQVKRELGIARCGLACCLCHENITCNGCNSDECKDKEWCENRKCSIEKEISKFNIFPINRNSCFLDSLYLIQKI